MKPSYPPEYEAHCREALERALTQAPAYRAWRALDPGPDASVDRRFAALPVTTKKELREHFPDGFLPAGMDREQGLKDGVIEHVRTSGSTDERVTLFWHQPWWDASERASWRLNAHTARASLGEHGEAILTSPICTGFLCEQGSLSMEERRLGRFLYLNEKLDPTGWDAAHLERMLSELGRFQPAVLEANPALLAKLARYAADAGRAVFQPAVVILTYEFPSRLYLRQIRRAFQCPVVSSYGSTETGYVFMQCEAGRFHQNVASCRVDFEPLRAEHGGPALGRILVTPFGNPWFALLRFSVGDLIRLDSAAPCPCGRREGHTATAIEGRLKDLTFTTDGAAVTVNRVDAALAGVEGLLAYQLVQTDPAGFRLQVVSEARPSPAEEGARRALQDLYGAPAQIAVERVEAVPPQPSGKHRLAWSEVPFDAGTLFAAP